MARVFKHSYTMKLPDGTRESRKTKKWYVEWTDAQGVVRRKAGFTDKRATEALAQEMQKQVDREKAGIVDRDSLDLSESMSAPINAHIDAYVVHLESHASPRHVSETSRRLRVVIEACGFRRLNDIKSEPLSRWCACRHNEGLSPRTCNTYLSSIRAFVRWCLADRRILRDPLVTIRKFDESANTRRNRRALTADELSRLFKAAAERPLREAMLIRRGPRKGQLVAKLNPDRAQELHRLGQERRLIYLTLVLTVLRKGELEQITWGDFEIDGKQHWLTVRANVSKNRKEEPLPIRADLAKELRNWRSGCDNARDSDRVFTVPKGLVRILDQDLVAAGIAKLVVGDDGVQYIDKTDDRGRTIDVHCLRHTTATLLMEGGASPRIVQRLMRHSDIRLTMDRYTDVHLLDTSGALEVLPHFAERETSAEPARATGTYDDPAALGGLLGGKGRTTVHFGATAFNSTEDEGEVSGEDKSASEQDLATPCNAVQESGRRDSNAQHSAWKADALPLSYARETRTLVYRRRKGPQASDIDRLASMTRGHRPIPALGTIRRSPDRP